MCIISITFIYLMDPLCCQSSKHMMQLGDRHFMLFAHTFFCVENKKLLGKQTRVTQWQILQVRFFYLQ